jgi:hypothetical protein
LIVPEKPGFTRLFHGGIPGGAGLYLSRWTLARPPLARMYYRQVFLRKIAGEPHFPLSGPISAKGA